MDAADLKRLKAAGMVKEGRTVGEALARVAEQEAAPRVGEFTCTLPYPPSVNSYWRHTVFLSLETMAQLAALFAKKPKYTAVLAVLNRCVRVLISERGRDYRNAVKHLLGVGRALSGPLALELVIRPPDQRRRDLDNALKAVLDSMQHAGVYTDDSQIRRLVVEWGPKKRDGEVAVRLSPMPEPQGLFEGDRSC